MLFDENGNEIEGAMTSDEIENLIDETKEEIETSNKETINELEDDYKERLDNLQTEIIEKEEELEKEKVKDKNFGNLRKTTKEKDDAIAKLTEEIDTMKATLENQIGEIKSGSIQEKINERIGKLSGKDKELEAKILLNLKSFKNPENAEEALEQVNNAYTLSGGKEIQSIINSKIISSAGGVDTSKSGKGTSTEAKNFGKKNFGLTDQDYEKYGNK